MSKILESLKAGAAALTQHRSADAPESAKSEHQMTQEQLADIYFSSSEKARRSDQPLVIKVIERPRGSGIAPWLITSIAFLITALSLFTTKRVFIDVKVIDDKSLVASDWQDASGGKGLPAENGAVSGLPLQDFLFEGAAKINSAKSDLQLTLVNSSVAPFARATLSAAVPLDLSASKIIFYAKGVRGGENLAFALKDRGNNLAFAKGKFFPFPEKLGHDWQRAEIRLSETPGGFDPKNVTTLRFEFGSRDIENKPGDTILIKDLQLASL